MLTVYVGYDSREPVAWDVCAHSIESRARFPVNVQPLKMDKLAQRGLMWREVERRHGQMFDVISNAPQSTEFAISRFLVPILHQTGWVIFMDCDMVLLGDINEITKELDDRYALMCVKHDHQPKERVKMDGQQQTGYQRKNWSSFFAVNCDHPANQRLTLEAVNSKRGLDLHQFYWLKDEEIGALSTGWNWLVDVQPMPDVVHVAHFTLGGPWFDGWKGSKHDYLWELEHENYTACTANR